MTTHTQERDVLHQVVDYVERKYPVPDTKFEAVTYRVPVIKYKEEEYDEPYVEWEPVPKTRKAYKSVAYMDWEDREFENPVMTTKEASIQVPVVSYESHKEPYTATRAETKVYE